MNTSQEFAKIAPLYDLDYGDFEDDIDMYLNFAERTGGPILELGVGTGRLARAFVDAGYRVVGIDASREMLEICRAKFSAYESRLINLLIENIEDFKIEEKFALAVSAANSFGHLLSRGQQVAALRRIREHLRPDGMLIIDLDNPERRLAVEREGELVLEWTKHNPETGSTVLKLVSSYFEHPKQLQHLTFIYDEMDNKGSVTRTLASFPLRYSFRGEIELLLDSTGYDVESIYGGYYLEDFDHDSDRMIIVARPKSL